MIDWNKIHIKEYNDGYKAGAYLCRCIYCHNRFIGRKWDNKCDDCSCKAGNEMNLIVKIEQTEDTDFLCKV